MTGITNVVRGLLPRKFPPDKFLTTEEALRYVLHSATLTGRDGGMLATIPSHSIRRPLRRSDA